MVPCSPYAGKSCAETRSEIIGKCRLIHGCHMKNRKLLMTCGRSKPAEQGFRCFHAGRHMQSEAARHVLASSVSEASKPVFDTERRPRNRALEADHMRRLKCLGRTTHVADGMHHCNTESHQHRTVLSVKPYNTEAST